MGDSYRPTPSPDLGCVRLIVLVTFYFVILTTFRCVPAFPPLVVLPLAAPSGSICGRGRAGVGVGVELRMSILISWLGGLTDC